MVKKITAPKTYNPGKGRPREHLAYLNQREMEYLRSINGNNMERGPRGLPSFPPDDAIGSSSKSGSSGTKSGTTTSKSGTDNSRGNTGRGAGSNYGAGSGRPGTSSGNSNLGGGNKGNSSSSPSRSSSGPASGAGGQRGAGSNYGPGSARPGTSTSSKGPSSPMGGQGTSFSSPKAAATRNDTVVQQRSAVNQTTNALRSNSALKGDLQVGGIRSLSVGPMGTQVSVSRAPTQSLSTANPTASSFVGPTYSPQNVAELNRQADALRDFLARSPDTFSPENPSGLPAPTVPDRIDVNDVYGPVQERIISIENVPEEPPVARTQHRIGSGPVRVSGGWGRTSYSPGDYTNYRNASDSVDVADDGIPRDAEGNVIGPETPGYAGPSYVDPVTQQPAYPEKSMPMKIAEHLGIVGKGLKLANWADKKMFDRMTPDQQAAAMQRWAENRASYGKDMGRDNDRGQEFADTEFDPNRGSQNSSPITRVRDGSGYKNSGARPQAYYNWDLGINIPSPGDPDYTLYQKYLKDKAAAQSAVL